MGLASACGTGPMPSGSGATTRQSVTPITTAAPSHLATPVTAELRVTAPVALVWQTDGAPHRLRLPTGLALDGSGRLLVVDAGNDRVQAIAGTEWTMLGGSYGRAPGQFRFREATDFAEPFQVSIVLGGGLAVDARGHIYVADPLNARIQKFDASGHLLAVWGDDHGLGERFDQPAGLAVDRDGTVYVADRGSHHILKLDGDGHLLARWGGLGSEAGALSAPMALVVDRRGQLYVADSGNARIQQFDAQGQFLRAWGGRGNGVGEFGGDVFLALDEKGHVYAADTANHRVQVFSESGVFLTQWGRLGVEDGQFSYAGGIAVDGRGDIYVADIFNGRIQRFRPRQPWPAALAVTPTPRPATPTPVPSAVPQLTPTDR
jgi:DNA-binding beta-propeller fold protein YncE